MPVMLLLGWVTFFQQSSFGQNLVWLIGKADNSPAEFALWPGEYKSFVADFGGETSVYQAGYSLPQQHWPFVLPGLLDSWAGGGYWAGFHPRHFPRIIFNLQSLPAGVCKLKIFFTDVTSKAPPLLRIEVNGHRTEKQLQPGKGTGLETNSGAGKPQLVTIDIPEDWLKKETNIIRLGNVSGSWAVFDAIIFECDVPLEIQKTSSTVIVSAKAAGFELLQTKKRVQPLLVDIVQLDKSETIIIAIDGQKPLVKIIEKGNTKEMVSQQENTF